MLSSAIPVSLQQSLSHLYTSVKSSKFGSIKGATIQNECDQVLDNQQINAPFNSSQHQSLLANCPNHNSPEQIGLELQFYLSQKQLVLSTLKGIGGSCVNDDSMDAIDNTKQQNWVFRKFLGVMDEYLAKITSLLKSEQIRLNEISANNITIKNLAGVVGFNQKTTPLNPTVKAPASLENSQLSQSNNSCYSVPHVSNTALQHKVKFLQQQNEKIYQLYSEQVEECDRLTKYLNDLHGIEMTKCFGGDAKSMTRSTVANNRQPLVCTNSNADQSRKSCQSLLKAYAQQHQHINTHNNNNKSSSSSSSSSLSSVDQAQPVSLPSIASPPRLHQASRPITSNKSIAVTSANTSITVPINENTPCHTSSINIPNDYTHPSSPSSVSSRISSERWQTIKPAAQPSHSKYFGDASQLKDTKVWKIFGPNVERH